MARAAIGVDLGGSHVMAAVVDESGEIHAKFEHEIEDHAPAAVVGALAEVVKSAIAATKHDVMGIGIGSPGNIDPAAGTIRYSPNFGWTDVPLGARVREAFPKYQVFVGNDARCATLGEYVHGVGRGTRDFVLLTLGTGIGGGIVADGAVALGYQMAPARSATTRSGRTAASSAVAVRSAASRRRRRERACSGTPFAFAPSFPRSTLLDPPPPRTKTATRTARTAGRGATGSAPNASARPPRPATRTPWRPGTRSATISRSGSRT